MTYNINLLAKKKHTPVELMWFFIINHMRYFLVFSLLVTNVVFLWRFSLDNDIAVLQEEKKQKLAVLSAESTKVFVKEANELNFKFIQAKDILNNQESFTKFISSVQAEFPQDVQLDSLSYDAGKMTILGSARDANVIKLFTETLQKSQNFSSANLTNLTKNGNDIKFSIVLIKKV
jgi:Tfp pilus assembly protein PilN